MTLSLSIDLGQSANFAVQQYKTNASNSRIVGIINASRININPPIYLKTKPCNNAFSVKILNEAGIVSTTAYDYVLTLHFEKIK
jgi:hypothetical protein